MKPADVPTVALIGGQARLLRAIGAVVLRLSQLHSQRDGAHARLLAAERDLERALGFAPLSPAPSSDRSPSIDAQPPR